MWSRSRAATSCDFCATPGTEKQPPSPQRTRSLGTVLRFALRNNAQRRRATRANWRRVCYVPARQFHSGGAGVRKARLFLFSATLLVTTSGIAGADTIYATVGPNGSVLLPTAYAIGGSLGLQQGDFFVPQMNARVGSLQGVFGWTYGLNSLEVQLLSDIGGRPGAVLDTFLFRNLPPHSDSVTLRPLQSANSTFMPELMAGATYWLIAALSTISHFGLILLSNSCVRPLFPKN